jgi:hypothetical protein
MPLIKAKSPHEWRELFSSTSGYGDVRRLYDAGYLTDEQQAQAIYELDHAGVVISRGLAERSETEGREIEMWELQR